jgi:hypothetical protein
MRDVTKATLKTFGTALCAGLIAITAIPSASEAGEDGHWRYGRDRYGNPDREWVDQDRKHKRHRHHDYHAPRIVERTVIVQRPVVVQRPVYVMPQPVYQMPMPMQQDRDINLNFTIPLR